MDCFALLAMTGEAAMIARRWHGRVPAEKAREYLQLMKDVGLPDYRATDGNRGAWCLTRRDGDVVHVEMFTFWENEAAIRRFAGNEIVKSFVDGVTAAATGAIAGAAIVLGRRAIIDLPTALIALGTLAALVHLKRIPEPVVIVLAGVIGLVIRTMA